jgi:uncharacterized membrane protein (UPF0127 family)
VFNALTLAMLTTMTVHAPRQDLVVEVARTEPEREHGLMDRKVLAAHTGMLFVFEADEPVAFWMKDTLIPLDMIFIGADGRVRRVFANVPVVAPTLADDRIPRESATARYVIELPANEAAADGIAAGAQLDMHGVPPAQ